jgi:glycosyltransferase involved in cell wall biosynthesis
MSKSESTIIIFSNYFPPHVGGLERYVEGLSAELAKRSGLQVHVITHRHDATLPCHEKSNRGVVIHRLRPVFTFANVFCIPHPLDLFRVLRNFSRSELKAVSVHTRFFPLSLMGACYGRWLSVPVIYTEHGSDYVRFPGSKLVEWVAKIYDHTLGWLTIALSTISTGASNSAARFSERLYSRKASVLRNSVKLDFWQECRSERNTHFVYVGRIAAGKGWDTAIRAHQAQSKEFRKSYPLYLIGDGAERDRMLKIIQGDPLIHYLGPQGQVGVRRSLVNGVLLNPTRLSESLQTVLIEAAAMKCWILSAPTEEARAFLENGFGKIVESDWEEAMRLSVQERPTPESEQLLSGYSWTAQVELFLGLLTSDVSGCDAGKRHPDSRT